MKSYDEMKYFPLQEEIVKAIQTKIQSDNSHFFRLSVAFYFSQLSTMMRTSVGFPGIPSLPTNMYCINMASSGAGKTLTTSFIEEQVMPGFKMRFTNSVLPKIADKNLDEIAARNAAKNMTEHEEELDSITKDYNTAGPMLFSFDSGTTAALKQIRQKLLLANCGSINMIMDEFGSNLLGNVEVLSTYLELFDGRVKQKLLKNTKENKRGQDIDGITPTNMLLFGTPSKIFNNPKVEEEFDSMKETGYARRCFFSYLPRHTVNINITPEERLKNLKCEATVERIQEIQIQLSELADVNKVNSTINVDDDIAIILLTYQLNCEKLADQLPEHMDVQKSEMANRYYKATKLAGTYAFISGATSLTEEHVYGAIKMAEDSGEAFLRLSNKEGNHIRLAHYIRDVDYEVTQVDLVENLPFYKGAESHRKDLMNLAMTYGYKNNIIIKRYLQDEIEFYKGESIPETDIKKMTVSYSKDLAENYQGEFIPFDDLNRLTQEDGYNWCVHHFLDNYRSSEKIIPGFNMVAIDVDDGVTIDVVKVLMKEYKYHLYTTKRHTKALNRFRIVLPLSHTVKLSKVDYKEFMNNIYEWLPFGVDNQTNDISRKWLSHNGNYTNNDGVLLDAFDFIPKTKKLEIRKQEIKQYGSLSGLERWMIQNTDEGNRSNQFVRYAFMLVDMGYDLEDIRDKLILLNTKIPKPLAESEILGTILVSTSKKIAAKTQP